MIVSAHASSDTLVAAQHDLDVRVLDAATGELPRELTIDLNRDYQPQYMTTA